MAVRSFGTEDRPSAKHIPPRSEVYEFIIFRGSDIKDLNVSEMPEEPSSPPQDPAILSTVSAFECGVVCNFLKSVLYLECIVSIAIHCSCTYQLCSTYYSGQLLSAFTRGCPATPSSSLQHPPPVLPPPPSHGRVFPLWNALFQTPSDDGGRASPHAARCDAVSATSSS